MITAGKTLCLRGGTYYGKFTSTLAGGTVRSYPGEWAVIDGYLATTLNGAINASQTTITLHSAAGIIPGGGIYVDNELLYTAPLSGNTIQVERGWGGTMATSHSNGAPVVHNGKQLTVSGSNTTYRDFEIKSSYPSRDWGSSVVVDTMGTGIVILGNGNSFINLIIHDNAQGIFSGSTSSNTLIYGCLIFNNGVYNPTAGMGLYLENASGYSRVYDTLVLNNFNMNVQAYGVTGPYAGGDYQRSVFAGAGAPVGVQNRNMIYGPGSVKSPTANISDCVFHHRASGGNGVDMGYGAGVGMATVTNNYFLGGATFAASNTDNMTFTRNKFDGIADRYAQTYLKPYTWNNNTYYRMTSSMYRLVKSDLGFLRFPDWQSTMGFDTASAIISSPMPDTVMVHPNAYEAGRANVVVYAPSSPATINLDLSATGLTSGQAYIVKNAFNYSGSPVLTGVYDATSPVISLPLTGTARTVASPTGMVATIPSTCPTFCSMILIPN